MRAPAAAGSGRPGAAYPWHWSVIPWFDGTPADLCEPGADQARVLGGFLRALHRAAPPDAPRNPYRGCALGERLAALAPRIARLRAHTDLFGAPLTAAWKDAVRAPIDVRSSWIHGDLHPRNVLVHESRVSAVIDWGDMAAGDAATDLASLWMLLATVAHRGQALDAYGAVSAATLRRARGWAILFGTVLADAGRGGAAGRGGDPRFRAIGERTLRRVLEGP